MASIIEGAVNEKVVGAIQTHGTANQKAMLNTPGSISHDLAQPQLGGGRPDLTQKPTGQEFPGLGSREQNRRTLDAAMFDGGDEVDSDYNYNAKQQQYQRRTPSQQQRRSPQQPQQQRSQQQPQPRSQQQQQQPRQSFQRQSYNNQNNSGDVDTDDADPSDTNDYDTTTNNNSEDYDAPSLPKQRPQQQRQPQQQQQQRQPQQRQQQRQPQQQQQQRQTRNRDGAMTNPTGNGAIASETAVPTTTPAAAADLNRADDNETGDDNLRSRKQARTGSNDSITEQLLAATRAGLIEKDVTLKLIESHMDSLKSTIAAKDEAKKAAEVGGEAQKELDKMRLEQKYADIRNEMKDVLVQLGDARKSDAYLEDSIDAMKKLPQKQQFVQMSALKDKCDFAIRVLRDTDRKYKPVGSNRAAETAAVLGVSAAASSSSSSSAAAAAKERHEQYWGHLTTSPIPFVEMSKLKGNDLRSIIKNPDGAISIIDALLQGHKEMGGMRVFRQKVHPNRSGVSQYGEYTLHYGTSQPTGYA